MQGQVGENYSALLLSLRNSWVSLLKEYIMLLSCWEITIFGWSFLMIDVVSRSCYGKVFVSVWYKYVNREAIG